VTEKDPVVEIDELHIELCILQSHLDRLLSRIHQNEAKLHRFQSLETQLLAINSLRELVEHILEDTKAVFELDFVSLVLIDPKKELQQFLKEDGLAVETRPELIPLTTDHQLKPWFGKAFHAYLGPCKNHHRMLFPGGDQKPDSIALLPLVRRRELLGCLNLGSSEPTRFTYGMATDFLDRLRSILSVCLENTRNFEMLRRTSLIDALTGVNNRRFFEQRLGEEIHRAQRTGEPLSFLFVDIDYFKRINDTYGHQTGDMVLAEIAGQIRSQLRNNDVLARYGGEEFVAILSGAELDRAMEVAERIRSQIERHTISDQNNQPIPVTISIGVSEYNPKLVPSMSKEDTRGLMELADQALYRAKRSGRNQVSRGGVYRKRSQREQIAV